MLRTEILEISIGICDRRGNFRGMTFDEEMEVSRTVELELERRLPRLQKLPVMLHPPRHNGNQRMRSTPRVEHTRVQDLRHRLSAQ